MTTLGALFAHPLHVASWNRPIYPLPGWNHYRVTNPFDGLDLVNGGLHQAVDVGNKSRGIGNNGMDDPVLAPVDCRARALANPIDGANGVRFRLAANLYLDAWHLNAVDLSFAFTEVKAGQKVGRTGNTGALVNGKPMPAHTHIELWHHKVRIDPHPYLLMVEQAPLPLPEDDMKLLIGQALTVGDVGKGNRLRVDPMTAAGSVITPDTIQVKVLQTDTTGEPYTLDGSTNNRYTTVALPTGEVYYVAAPLVTGIRLKGRGLEIPTFSQADVDAARYDGRKTMREEAINAITGLRV